MNLRKEIQWRRNEAMCEPWIRGHLDGRGLASGRLKAARLCALGIGRSGDLSTPVRLAPFRARRMQESSQQADEPTSR